MNKPMKTTLIGILVLLLAACGPLETTPAPAPMEDASTVTVANESNPEMFSRYIGLNYPPLPEGLSENFGMLIQDAEDHSLSLVLDSANEMLWLSKMTHYDSNGAAYWEVKDVLELSHLEAGLILIPDGCLLNGVPDHEILVVSKDETIQFAWRANTTLDTFEVMSANGIECHSDKGVSLK